MMSAPTSVPRTEPSPPDRLAAADDHGGNHIQFQTRRHGGVADGQPRELHHAGQAGERAAQGVE